MDNIKYIFFDCMETIVDLYELPTVRDYALWAFSGSGVEYYWYDFNDFLHKYEASKSEIATLIDKYEEYELIRRFELLVEKTESISKAEKEQVAIRLYKNYWNTYKSKCFVKQEVKDVLLELSRYYHLAVVSNFMVKNGIEDLLQTNGILNLFNFVVTSINVGWRKPNPKIYNSSMQIAGCMNNEIVFVGDDYENDYSAPRAFGMNSVLLDKSKIKTTGIKRISNFNELKAALLSGEQ